MKKYIYVSHIILRLLQGLYLLDDFPDDWSPLLVRQKVIFHNTMFNP